MNSSTLSHTRRYGISILGPRSLGVAVSSLIFLTAIAAVLLLARAPFGEIYGTLLGGAGSTRTAAITLYGTTKPKVEMSVAEKEGGAYVILSIEDVVPDRVMLPAHRSKSEGGSSPSSSEGVSKHIGQATPAFASPSAKATGDREASAGRQGDTATITLTIPGSWHLEEVRGAHASNIALYAASERTTLIIPMALLDSPSGARSKRTVKLTFTTNEKFEAIAFTHDASSPALFTLIHLTLPGGASEKKSEIVEESTTVEL